MAYNINLSSSTPDCQIRYELGVEFNSPSEIDENNSPIYTTPFTAPKNFTAIRTQAFKENYFPSDSVKLKQIHYIEGEAGYIGNVSIPILNYKLQINVHLDMDVIGNKITMNEDYPNEKGYILYVKFDDGEFASPDNLFEIYPDLHEGDNVNSSTEYTLLDEDLFRLYLSNIPSFNYTKCSFYLGSPGFNDSNIVETTIQYGLS